MGEAKVQLCLDVIQCIRNKSNSLSSKRSVSLKDAAGDKENKNHENNNKDKFKSEKNTD